MYWAYKINSRAFNVKKYQLGDKAIWRYGRRKHNIPGNIEKLLKIVSQEDWNVYIRVFYTLNRLGYWVIEQRNPNLSGAQKSLCRFL